MRLVSGIQRAVLGVPDTADEITVVCAWCGRVRGRKGWRRKLRLRNDAISHGICPHCLERELDSRDSN